MIALLAFYVVVIVGIYPLTRWLSVRGKPHPQVGDVWEWKKSPDDNPWEGPSTQFKIFEIKDGWAGQQYSHLKTGIRIDTLRRCYRRVSP